MGVHSNGDNSLKDALSNASSDEHIVHALVGTRNDIVNVDECNVMFQL
jgi:hypothetical protein